MNSKTYHIKLNGKVYEVEIEEVKKGQNIQSKNEVKENKVSEVKKTPITKGNEETISAPMPGTITNILVKENDSVKKGDVLAILEAMKMENEIIAPSDGNITSISVDKGQTVNLGDILLQMA